MITWLAAFVLQSTFWMGLAWLSTRLFPRMQPRNREAIWYTAVAASLVVSTVQTLVPDSLGSLWRLTLPGALFAPSDVDSFVGANGAAFGSGAAVIGWETILLYTWLAVAGLLVLRYVGQLVVLRRRLARDKIVGDAPEALILRDIGIRAGLPRTLRLSESDNLGSPIAIGLGARSEVCVPTRAIHELDAGEFRAMLAHEVAHHVRRDPLRLGVANLIRLLFFFQPLFRIASRDVHLAAEEQCDAWAASQVNDRLAMASCLTEVARWVRPGDRELPAVGLMRGPSQLVRRVNNLMDERRVLLERGGFRRLAGSVLVLALAPWFAPGLVTGDAHALEASVLEGDSAQVTAPVATRSRASDDEDGSEDEGHEEELGGEANEGAGEHAEGPAPEREHVGERGADGGEHDAGDGDHSPAEYNGVRRR